MRLFSTLSIYVPEVAYGATNGARKQHNQQFLNVIQMLPNVLLTGTMPSTLGAALVVITGIIHITYQPEDEAAKGALQLTIIAHWQHPSPRKPSV